MKKLFVSLPIAILMLCAGHAHAQTFVTPTNGVNTNTFCTGGKCTYVPLEPLPGLPNVYGPSQGSFPDLINRSFKLLIGGGAVIAVIMIVLGALTYMFSDIVGNKKKALDRIRGAMWAIVLLVSSYLILYTINPDLVKLSLNLGTAGNSSGSPANTPANTATPAQQTLTPVSMPTQAEINQCESAGGYYAFTSGNSSRCMLPSTPI